MARKVSEKNSLQELIHTLNEQEYEVLQKYLTVFASRFDENPKSMKLLELLRKSKTNITDRECSIEIYGQEKDNRIEKLKSRLKQKILDSLTNEINLDRIKNWDEIELVQIKLRKKIAQYYYLYLTKKNSSSVNQIVDDILKIASKYEVYAVSSEALKFKKRHIGFVKGERYFDSLNEKIRYFERCQESLNISNDASLKSALKFSAYSNKTKSDYIINLQQNIIVLTKEYKISKSSEIFYQLLVFKRDLQNLLGNYTKARHICEQLLELLKTNMVVSRKLRIGSVYLNFSENSSYCDKFIDALHESEQALLYFSPKTTGYIFAQELSFYALFYACEYLNGLIKTSVLITKSKEDISEFRLGKFQFFHANVHFKLNKFHDTLKILRQNSALSQDKTGWDIGLRTLVILCHIELENYDEASSSTEALRKLLERSGRDMPIRERDKLIFKLLSSLASHSYDFEKAGKAQAKALTLLNSKDKKYRWEPFTHELFKFNEWFESKLIKKSL